MASEILFELQDVLSKVDFETIEAFIVLYNTFRPEEAGQARVGFEFFIQNLKQRYKREFKDSHKVLSINLEELEPELIDRDLSRGQRSPESEKRRNMGKMRRNCGDNYSRLMCDNAARIKHSSELAEASKLSQDEERTKEIKKEHSRYSQYEAGQKASSPIRQLESE